MAKTTASLRLYGVQLDALNNLLAVVLNDPDDAIVSDWMRQPLEGVLDSVITAIREGVK